jgi:hypothetical protein
MSDKGFLEDLEGLEKPRVKKGPDCSVGALRRVLDDEVWEKLCSLIDSPKVDGRFVSSTEIAALLQRWGFDVKAATVARHRKRVTRPGVGCACPLTI